MAPGFQSLRGQFLLDGGKLAGSFFCRTVVLICQHDAEGAFGLVLNRSSESVISEVLDEDVPDALRAHTVYVGGPVQPAALSFLHTESYLLDANVLPNVHLDHSLENLVELGQSFSPTQKIRVFAGYAGWSPGQLEEEMRQRAWLTHPASVEWIFNDDPETLWRRILWAKGGKYRLLAQAPEDLSRN